ncbi:endonuclease/exonuclease/phosphatase family protein [Aliiruegeria haliotis]|uniref:Endonuclease/exonuclease/phosphatase family protein n=1 Tax=Aliiruegeria haliotis TaxID=1280846 RepID=A0A2T0RI36_9RHOB|nr:endonuclease/exonuclease/phosphatase family protein [Aliiruegeria haliotis]PRY20874.1 endonuclease/exonuclease/phosphatase family protein [Aliiruegeria haliotis]
MLATIASAGPETIRVATFSTELSRKGPGLLLRDILKGQDPQISAVADVIATVRPDVVLLTDFDYDHGRAALEAFARVLSESGVDYPYAFSARPNAGQATGLDLDRNGRLGEPRDAQGYGRFAGQGGVALLSRFPLHETGVVDFSGLLWRDLPGARLPFTDAGPFLSVAVEEVQRLSSTTHLMVPVSLPDGATLTLLAFAATPPVFDGTEDRNGLRNADEIALWARVLDGAMGVRADGPLVVLGKANLDPQDGEGLHRQITELLSHPRLQDARPRSDGGAVAQSRGHEGDPGLDTADWSEPEDNGPGNLRVDYVLPSRDVEVVDAGVFWPSGGVGLELVEAASRHRLVWVDLRLP